MVHSVEGCRKVKTVTFALTHTIDDTCFSRVEVFIDQWKWIVKTGSINYGTLFVWQLLSK